MRVAANLNMFHTELDLLARYEKVAAAGFRLIEVSLPYSHPAEHLRAAADKFGLQHVLINAPPGDWAAGFRGLASLSAQKNAFRESLEKAVQYAKVLDCPRIHVMAGISSDSGQDSESTYLENLNYASDRLQKENIMCLVEPINKFSIPNYYLNSYVQAISVIQKINSPNLKIMFVVFHAQQICGQLTNSIKYLRDYIGHVQVAQVPARNEPDTDGEINYGYVFKILKETNPDWIIGCEYTQSHSEDKRYEWVKKYGLEF